MFAIFLNIQALWTIQIYLLAFFNLLLFKWRKGVHFLLSVIICLGKKISALVVPKDLKLLLVVFVQFLKIPTK